MQKLSWTTTAIDMVPVAIFGLAREGPGGSWRIAYCNAQAARATGRGAVELLGTSAVALCRLLSGGDLRLASQLVSGQSFCATIADPSNSGATLPLRGIPLADEPNAFLLVLGPASPRFLEPRQFVVELGRSGQLDIRDGDALGADRSQLKGDAAPWLLRSQPASQALDSSERLVETYCFDIVDTNDSRTLASFTVRRELAELGTLARVLTRSSGVSSSLEVLQILLVASDGRVVSDLNQPADRHDQIRYIESVLDDALVDPVALALFSATADTGPIGNLEQDRFTITQVSRGLWLLVVLRRETANAGRDGEADRRHSAAEGVSAEKQSPTATSRANPVAGTVVPSQSRDSDEIELPPVATLQRRAAQQTILPAAAEHRGQLEVVRWAQEPPKLVARLNIAPAPSETQAGESGGDERMEPMRVLASLGAGVISLTREGRVALFSSMAEQIWRSTASRASGRPIDALIIADGDGEETAWIRCKQARPDQPFVFDAMCRRDDGTLAPVQVHASRASWRVDQPFVLTIVEIKPQRQTEDAIRNLAYHDLLTGLPNRLLFADRIRSAVGRARRAHELLAVMLVDLDRFKLFNDSLGLQRGDEVIRLVAERLATHLPASATLARLGGDEFMVLLQDLKCSDAAAEAAVHLLECLLPSLTIGGHELTITASVGIALFPHDGDDAESLIQNADIALSRAKEQGRAQYKFFTDDMNVAAFERLMLETRLRKALKQNELIVHYQAQICADSQRIIGVEALMRWQHPDLGMISPGEFIPLAEETGLIVPMGEWALHEACRQVKLWHDADLGDIRLAVNLSAHQFQHPEVVSQIENALHATSFPADLLELELTESVIMREGGEVVDRLAQLRAIGPSLAIDDFGTGYSSLAYLKRFPIRSLKIDRSFVRDIDRDQNSAAIAQAVVALGMALDLKVVAEGVETETQLEKLRIYGCHEVQGFLFGPPLPPDEMAAMLRRGTVEAIAITGSNGKQRSPWVATPKRGIAATRDAVDP